MKNLLTHLGFSMHSPSPALRPFVQCYWRIEKAYVDAPAMVDFLHPEGGSGIVFNFGDPLIYNDIVVSDPCRISGPVRQSTRMQASGRVDALGVRFRPGMGYGFFRQPLRELVNFHVRPEELSLSFPGDLLAEQLAELCDSRQRLMYLDQALQRAFAAEMPHLEFVRALQYIQGHHGQPEINQLSRELNIGQRQMERQFNHWLGLSPKHYGRLLRVRHARDLIKQTPPDNSLTDMAYEAGYYDQPHFIHEFKQVVGLTPGQYLRRHKERQAKMKV